MLFLFHPVVSGCHSVLRPLESHCSSGSITGGESADPGSRFVPVLAAGGILWPHAADHTPVVPGVLRDFHLLFRTSGNCFVAGHDGLDVLVSPAEVSTTRAPPSDCHKTPHAFPARLADAVDGGWE